MSARLTSEEAAAVLRRAAELDSDPLDEPGQLDESVLRQAAAEVGLSNAAVDRAVAEWRAGALVPLPVLAPERVHGLPVRADVSRVLPAAPDEVLPRVESWLRGQVFEPRRGPRDARDWTPSRGAVGWVRRASRFRLRDVRRVRVQVTASPTGSRVSLAAELDAPSGWGFAGRIVVPGAAVGGAVLLVVSGVAPDLLLALPAGAAASGASWRLLHSRMVERHGRVTEELEAALDALLAPKAGPSLPAWLPPRAQRWAGRFGLSQ